MSVMMQSKLIVKLTSSLMTLPTLEITRNVNFSTKFASVLMMIELSSFVIHAGLKAGSRA